MTKTKKKDIASRRQRRRQQRVVRLRSDLQWCYDRLSHLLYIWANPCSVEAGFGPSETMGILSEDLPKIRAIHKLTGYADEKQPNDKISHTAGRKE